MTRSSNAGDLLMANLDPGWEVGVTYDAVAALLVESETVAEQLAEWLRDQHGSDLIKIMTDDANVVAIGSTEPVDTATKQSLVDVAQGWLVDKGHSQAKVIMGGDLFGVAVTS